MRFEATFLRTRVARRVLLLFIGCSLLPIVALAGLSYVQVSEQLRDQSADRLRQAGKAASNAIVERLQAVSAELERGATRIREGRGFHAIPPASPQGEGVSSSGFPRRAAGSSLAGVALVRADSVGTRITGSPAAVPPELTPATASRILSGLPAVVTWQEESVPAVAMGRMVDPSDPVAGVLWGRIDPDFLWTTAETYAALTSEAYLCVLDDQNRPLRCDPETRAGVAASLPTSPDSSLVVSFEWSAGDQRFVASYRSVFLRWEFGIPGWAAVLSESRASALAPLTSFRGTFLLVVLLALWVVTLVSNIQIRRSLDPIARLDEGTRRIAEQAFDTRVHVETGDEFEDLATSFNRMADRLGSQFRTLTTLGAMDRAALSAPTGRHYMREVMASLADMFPGAFVAVHVRPEGPAKRGWSARASAGGSPLLVPFDWTESDLESVRRHPRHFITNGGCFGDDVGPTEGAEPAHVFPLFREGRPLGALSLRPAPGTPFTEDDTAQARRMADQLALSLSHVQLFDQLEKLSAGALTALARAVDASSPWTLGHSERVAETSVAVARELGLPDEELALLYRGGLLHDIGKIGVSNDILDKAGRLTREERDAIRAHVTIGARILEPIEAYADLIPIVRSHHERYDGLGYPDGLSGGDIPFHARILSVADTFDALISDRPYRPGTSRARAVALIAAEAGTQLDPVAVEAFLRVFGRESGVDRAPSGGPSRRDTAGPHPHGIDLQEVPWPT